MEVSKDKIRAELLKHVTENTCYSIPFNGVDHGSLENAITHHINEMYNEINQFHTLTQSNIDEQNSNYSEDYLYGADVGSAVWAGDSELYLSLSNIEDCVRDAEDRLDDDFNDIADIARYVQFTLIAAQLDK